MKITKSYLRQIIKEELENEGKLGRFAGAALGVGLGMAGLKGAKNDVDAHQAASQLHASKFKNISSGTIEQGIKLLRSITSDERTAINSRGGNLFANIESELSSAIDDGRLIFSPKRGFRLADK